MACVSASERAVAVAVPVFCARACVAWVPDC